MFKICDCSTGEIWSETQDFARALADVRMFRSCPECCPATFAIYKGETLVIPSI